HDAGQIKYALSGIMVISSTEGHWVVPPTRALWLAPGVRHRVRMLGKVRLRSVFVNPEFSHGLPEKSCMLPVSSLFREVIAVLAGASYTSMPGRRIKLLMNLLLEEVNQELALPLYLPTPRDT